MPKVKRESIIYIAPIYTHTHTHNIIRQVKVVDGVVISFLSFFRHLSPFRAALEDSLFQQEEYKNYETAMCSEIMNLCDPHEITSPGEL